MRKIASRVDLCLHKCKTCLEIIIAKDFFLMKMTVLLLGAMFLLTSCIADITGTTRQGALTTSDATGSTARATSSTSGSTSDKGEEKNWEYDK